MNDANNVYFAFSPYLYCVICVAWCEYGKEEQIRVLALTLYVTATCKHKLCVQSEHTIAIVLSTEEDSLHLKKCIFFIPLFASFVYILSRIFSGRDCDQEKKQVKGIEMHTWMLQYPFVFCFLIW